LQSWRESFFWDHAKFAKSRQERKGDSFMILRISQ
jgi:hypothetical protein